MSPTLGHAQHPMLGTGCFQKLPPDSSLEASETARQRTHIDQFAPKWGDHRAALSRTKSVLQGCLLRKLRQRTLC
eukprot:4228992-Amphidinium_carterae.1